MTTYSHIIQGYNWTDLGMRMYHRVIFTWMYIVCAGSYGRTSWLSMCTHLLPCFNDPLWLLSFFLITVNVWKIPLHIYYYLTQSFLFFVCFCVLLSKWTFYIYYYLCPLQMTREKGKVHLINDILFFPHIFYSPMRWKESQSRKKRNIFFCKIVAVILPQSIHI